MQRERERDIGREREREEGGGIERAGGEREREREGGRMGEKSLERQSTRGHVTILLVQIT